MNNLELKVFEEKKVMMIYKIGLIPYLIQGFHIV